MEYTLKEEIQDKFLQISESISIIEERCKNIQNVDAFLLSPWGMTILDAVSYTHLSDAEVAYFLDEAMKSSKVVGDYIVGKLADNTDTPEGMNASLVSINPYYTMFCDENMEGYDEILMWKQFKDCLLYTSLSAIPIYLLPIRKSLPNHIPDIGKI